MYFSGFCLKNEKILFKEYIEENDFTVSGFSYGAIKALEYTLNSISLGDRIDKLQLFSPAYFMDKTEKFKRLQLIFFKKNEIEYKDNFIKNIIYPSDININNYIVNGKYEELNKLLNYQWNIEDLELLVKKNVKIEVFIGSDDKIINSEKTKEFFKKISDVYYIKNVGHILR